MGFANTTLWWLVAGVLVAVELASGTFYLLMLAGGGVAGAAAAHLGWSSSAQIATAALAGGGATVAWHLRRSRKAPAAPSESNADVNIDIGQHVHVDAWLPDGSARVQYRGAGWSVRHAGSGPPVPGDHVIVALHGSQLQVAPATAN